MKRILSTLAVLLSFSQIFAVTAARADSVIEEFPGLKKFISTERASNIYFGFGVNPFMIVNSKIGFSASLIQIHWIKDNFDFEVFNGSFGSVFGGQYGSEQMFVLRTAPKYKIFKNFSIGPVLGFEFVHFPDVQAELTKNNYYTPPFAYSTSGFLYGFTIAETFDASAAKDKSSLFRVSETVYKETYSTVGTNNGWKYYYVADSLNGDPSPIQNSMVFVLEVSYLF